MGNKAGDAPAHSSQVAKRETGLAADRYGEQRGHCAKLYERQLQGRHPWATCEKIVQRHDGLAVHTGPPAKPRQSNRAPKERTDVTEGRLGPRGESDLPSAIYPQNAEKTGTKRETKMGDKSRPMSRQDITDKWETQRET